MCVCMSECEYVCVCVNVCMCVSLSTLLHIVMWCFRSIVAFYEESIKIKAQRTLLQPIQFTADISNSLSSNVTSVPSTCIKANLGNVKVRNILCSYYNSLSSDDRCPMAMKMSSLL